MSSGVPVKTSTQSCTSWVATGMRRSSTQVMPAAISTPRSKLNAVSCKVIASPPSRVIR